jgi:nucleotide-binding universal stress UspA family protein
VGVDGSLAGLRALRLAVAEARRRGAPLYAVRTWNFNPGWGAWGASPQAWLDDFEAEAVQVITRAFDEAMGGPPPDLLVGAVIVRGAPGQVLVELANRDDDVLFVGAQRRRGLRARLHHCVARFCAAHALCPVVIVPADAFARLACQEGLGRAVRRELPILSG